MFEISHQDRERLLRMATLALGHLAVEILKATEPFKSSLRPQMEIQPALPTAKPQRKRKAAKR